MRKLLVLCMLLTLFNSSLAFDCYLCSTINDPNCGKDFVPDNVKTQTCELLQNNELQRHPKSMDMQQDAPYCVKYQGADSQGKIQTARTCSTLGTKSCEVIKERGMEEGSTILGCEICNTHLCNSASSMAALPIFCLTILVALKML